MKTGFLVYMERRIDGVLINLAKMDMISKGKNNLILQSKSNCNSFHSAMKLSLRIAQCFGLFPISVGGHTYKSKRFRWLHWRTVYSLATFILFTGDCVISLYQDIPKPHSILDIDGMIYDINAVVHFVLMFKLTLQWHEYVEEWHKIERKCRPIENSGNLRNTLNTIVLSILILATDKKRICVEASKK
ncbi:hypothetical protein JTB14_034409 [Gonioctena quinquepunctata]|nr:hypothetical protein JTB14_034409 [Gonioctena quinquepunctata]